MTRRLRAPGPHGRTFPRPARLRPVSLIGRRWALGLGLWVQLGACASPTPGGVESSGPGLQVVLPSEPAGVGPIELFTSVLAPIIPMVDGPSRFLECRDLLLPLASPVVDPDRLGEAPAGLVLENRRPLGMAEGASLVVPWPTIPVLPNGNPWGAALVYVEARVPAQDRAGRQAAATALSGCTCFRTQEATHPDPVLDAAVRAQCPLAEPTPRPLPLQPIPRPGWRLSHEGATTLVAPVGQVMVPGAVVRVTPPDADHRAAGSLVLFAIDLGAGPGPWRPSVADAEGIATFRPTLEGCAEGARILARLDRSLVEPLVFPLRCVPGLQPFEGARGVAQASQGLVFEIVERGRGRTPWLATISSEQPELLRLEDPAAGVLAVAPGPSYQPAAIFTFKLEENADPGRPMVASIWDVDGAPSLRVHEVDPERGTLTEVAAVSETCATWTCGSGRSCDPSQPCVPNEACVLGKCQRIGGSHPACRLPAVPPTSVAGCGCAWSYEYGRGPLLIARDLNGDGLTDLVVGGDQTSALVEYPAFDDGGPIYRPQACNCGTYGSPPQGLQAGRFRSVDGRPELAIATTFGLGLVAQDPSRGLVCSAPRYVGPEFLQEVEQANLGCTPALDPSCAPFQDLILRSRLVTREDRSLAVIPGGPGLLGPPWFPNLIPDLEDGRTVSMAVGDLNGDGHHDLLTLRLDANNKFNFRAFLGAGNGALSVVRSKWPYEHLSCDERSLRLADLDADGRDEILMYCPFSDSGPEISVFRSPP